MRVSNSDLMQTIRTTLSNINLQIHAQEQQFERERDHNVAAGRWAKDATIYDIRRQDGTPVLEALLLAKSNCLNALATLQGGPKI